MQALFTDGHPPDRFNPILLKIINKREKQSHPDQRAILIHTFAANYGSIHQTTNVMPVVLVFGTQKSSALQPVNNGVAVTTAVKSHTHNVPSFDNSGHDLFDFNQGILLKKSVSDSANPYKQGNNFHPAIKTDAQRPITFKEDTSTYTLRNRVKPAQKYDVFALRHILI